MKNDELTVRTPLGELVVGIKADPDYPGISAAFWQRYERLLQ